MILPPPKSKKAELLFLLLSGKKISERRIKFNSYRSRLSDIESKHGVTLKEKFVQFKNEFGHQGQCKEKWLEGWENINHAHGVYKEINK